MKYKLHYENLPILTAQIREHFFKSLQKTVEEELDHRAYRKYFDWFYQSGFYKKFDLRTEQIARQIYDLYCAEEPINHGDIDQILDATFQSFTDHFIVVHCTKLHKMELPQAMLRYHNVSEGSYQLSEMIFDFLNFDLEPEKVYLDFIELPKSKLKNARDSFLFSKPEEKIFFICDQTVFGSCTEGFSMTEKALYWKSHFNPPGKADFNNIDSIKRESEWITINEQFFNVSKSMNYKMMKLLQKIKEVARRQKSEE